MITALIIMIVVLLYLILIMKRKNKKIRNENNDLKVEIHKIKDDNNMLKYNYTNLIKIYKSSLNKIKNLQKQLKNKGK